MRCGMSTLDEVKTKYQALAAERTAALRLLDEDTGQVRTAKAYNASILQTSALLKRIMREAQADFKAKVDDVVTMAVKSLFDEGFRFDLDIKTGGQSLQCKPVIWETYADGYEVERAAWRTVDLEVVRRWEVVVGSIMKFSRGHRVNVVVAARSKLGTGVLEQGAAFCP